MSEGMQLIAGQGMGVSPELKSAIDKFIEDNKIVLFMKGNRMFPQCGFSNTCVQVITVLQTSLVCLLHPAFPHTRV